MEVVQLAENVSFTIWGVGGGAKLCPLWRHYFSQAQGIVFIIGPADLSRFDKAKKELNDVELGPGTTSSSEVAIIFGFDSVDTGRILVQGTSALTGKGIGEALMELRSKIRTSNLAACISV